MLKKILANPFFVFPVASVLFFWPVSFLLFTLKNDALTYYYPVRTLISDALRNGELPLWTPYINMGYPLHADMQSAAWNPIVWLFGFVSNYSLAAFHYELLFYIAFAGIGFYYLCRNLGCTKLVAITVAFAYQFSGFMIDSVQFFPCISAACYLPWIILFFKRMMVDYKTKDALLLGFCLYLLFTGSYPSLFIITAYTLAAYVLFYFFQSRDKYGMIKKCLPPLGIACFLFAALSLPAILSFITHLKMIGRGQQQTLSFVLENSMNPATSLSLIAPFASTANNHFLESSILMRNMYMGIIPLLFLVFGLCSGIFKRNKELSFYLFMALIMIGLAWGSYFFFRQIAFYIFPLMDRFRHPALFRLFSIFFLLLITAVSIKEWQSNFSLKESLLKKIFIFSIALVLLTGIISFIFRQNQALSTGFSIGNIKALLTTLNFQQRFLIQLPFIIAVLLIGYFIVIKNKSIKLLCLLTMADLFFATQLNMPVTVIGAKKFEEVNKLINRNSEKFPLPGNQSIETISQNSSGESVITGSTLPFTKKMGRNDYYITPGNLSSQDLFYESALKDVIFKKPVLSLNDSNGKASIIVLSANKMKARTSSQQATALLYLQNYYPGWQVFVDGKKSKPEEVNISFMGTYLSPGDHNIEFRYRPTTIIIAWYISLAALLFFLFRFCFWSLFLTRQSAKPRMEN